MEKQKTVNIPIEIFKDVKIHCAKNDIKIKDFIMNSIKNELNKYDNNGESTNKNSY
jgi:hypothetical protein